MQFQSIRVVRPVQFENATAQTPGSQRLAAIHPGAGIESPLWGGLFVVETCSPHGNPSPWRATHDRLCS